MTSIVYTKVYEAPHVDRKEILRYAGVRGGAPEIEELLDECIREVEDKLTYKVCYSRFPVTPFDLGLDLGFFRTESLGLKKNLCGCDSYVIFAATVGVEIDRMIARYVGVSPVKSLIFQAIGSERVESLCDAFNRELKEEMEKVGFETRPRFSPGYGDFPLEVQRDIFCVLDCPRRIGVSLNESLLMSPSKSVTAVIGLSRRCDG